MTRLTLNLSPEAAARLADEAAARGMTTEALALETIEAWAAGDDLDWAEDERRLVEPGESIPVEIAFDRLEARIAAAHPGKK